MSNNSNSPQALISNAVFLITSTTVVGVLYTLVFLIYCLCIRLFYFQIRDLDGKIKRHTVLAFIFASIAMICATIDIVSLNLYSQGMFSGPSGVVVEVQGAPITLLIDNMATLVERTLILGVVVSFMMYHMCMISRLCSVVACQDYLEWNSPCHTHYCVRSFALPGFPW
jgi:hypothetical protein